MARRTRGVLKATTQVIAALPSGNKYDAAIKWNIPVVCHTWLIDCACNGNCHVFIIEHMLYLCLLGVVADLSEHVLDEALSSDLNISDLDVSYRRNDSWWKQSAVGRIIENTGDKGVCVGG
jgi:hypothetical protein